MAARIESEVARAEWGDALPPSLRNVSFLKWLAPLTGEQRVTIGLVVLAALLFVPWLGATGFWDPWEPHYGEVAREMIARGDYIHPWWESNWFFSKPALDLWLMAAGMLVANTNGPPRHPGIYTEWCVRFPYAAISALGAILMFIALNRTVGRRPAILTTFAMLTSPLVVFLARQAVPDPVFVGLLGAAMACLILTLLTDEPHDGWAAAFYCLTGLATLSKGLLGFALPGAVTLAWCLVTGEWARLKRLHLAEGAVLVLAVAGPWYFTMFGFAGRDEEGNTFFQRFIIHDHFKRLGAGVYTTTPGGSFVYFIEQLGFDAFPWVFCFPGALAAFARVRARPQTARERTVLFLLLWLLIGFAVFAFSATKFHHYAFPALLPLLAFCALWLDEVLALGLRAHAGLVLAGGLLYALVAHDLAMSPKHLTDMFVFNYDRPYPDREVDPRQVFGVLFWAAAAVALSPWLFDRFAQLTRRLTRKPALPPPETEAPQDRKVVALALSGLALAFAIYCGWFHWRALSPEWSQRDLFWIYYQQSKPDEPIGAYLMNWRGETFYSRNTVRQVGRSNVPPFVSLPDFLNAPGPRKWFLVEQARLAALRSAIGGHGRLQVVESRNNKFVLAVYEGGEQGTAPAAPVETKPVAPFGAPP